MRQIGAAVGNRVTATAQPLATVRARDGAPDWPALDALIEEWRPARLLVGEPLNMDGTASDMSLRAAAFARRLKSRFALPVELVDERLSTRAAKQLMQEEAHIRPEPAARHPDAVAAELILRTWLASEHA